MFWRKKHPLPITDESIPAPLPAGTLQADEPRDLLHPHRDRLLEIRSLCGVPDAHWSRLHGPAIERFAAWVQSLPASEAHHHPGPGGLLRHGLEVALEALKARRGMLLPPGATAEHLAEYSDLWTFAVLTAALLHDIGKPMADLRIALRHPDGRPAGYWCPLAGPMPTGQHYEPRFEPGRRYRRHERLGPLLAPLIIPTEGLAWLASEPELLECWLATLQGDDETAGPLGALIARADGLSVAQDLAGGSRNQIAGARAKPLADRLITGLRYLFTTEALPLNRPGAAAFTTDDDLWLVSKRVLDALREHLTAEGQTGIPTRNDRLMDELQQHQILIPNQDKAVWSCHITVGDWSQMLTCLRLPVNRVWPDPERRPVTRTCVVPGTEVEAELESPRAAPLASRVLPSPVERRNSALTAPTLDKVADLPLPFDIEPGLPPSPAGDESRSIPEAEAKPGIPSGPEGMAPPTESDIGKRFLAWLKTGIASRKLSINTSDARLHVVAEGLILVSPAIFRDFDPIRWDQAQKRFQRLGLHKKRPDSTNVWTCEVAGKRNKALIKGFLLENPQQLGVADLPPPNKVVSILR